MKKAILFFSLFCIGNIGKSQSYIPIVDTAKVWSVLINDNSALSTEFVKFIGDTIINSYTYKKIYYSNNKEQTEWMPIRYIREDTLQKKVQRIFWESEPYEFLQYDFNASKNDTITVNLEFTLTVDSIDFIEIDSKLRKRIFLHYLYTTNSNSHEVWIEGIGSLCGILYSGTYGYPDANFNLLCVSKNEEIIYQNPEYSSCNILTSIDDYKNSEIEIKIYPNPVIDNSIIEITNLKAGNNKIEFYNIFGNKIATELIDATNLINFRINFPAGIYFYSLVSNDKILKTERFLILQ